MRDQKIDAQLLIAKNAIDNSLAITAIKDAVALYGYDEATLLQGQALQQAAADAQNAFLQEYSEQYQATHDMEAAWAHAHELYMIHVELARRALSDKPGTWKALQINGSRKRSQSGWLQQAHAFYNNALANADVQAALGRFNIDATKLQDG